MRVQRHWIPPCGTRTGLKASAVLRACSMLHETPATPSTGSEWEIQIECDPPTQQSLHAGDYGGNFTFAARATGYRRRLSRGFRTACALPAKRQRYTRDCEPCQGACLVLFVVKRPRSITKNIKTVASGHLSQQNSSSVSGKDSPPAPRHPPDSSADPD